MSQMVSDLHSVLLALPEAAEVRSQQTATSGDQTQVFVVPGLESLMSQPVFSTDVFA